MATKPVITDEQARAFQKMLKDARERAGKTQKQIDAEGGPSQQFISTAERGPTPGMRLIETLQLLQYLNIQPNDAAAVLGLYTPPKESEAEQP